MSRISWGKPRIFVKDTDKQNSQWYELYTPAEDTTQLAVAKGDKMEARIEGGEAEDVKYKRSTYSVAFNIRKGKVPGGSDKRSLYPIQSIDGRVDHHFALLLQPEDPTCEGFYISDSTVSVDDTFNTAEGAMWQVTMDALRAKYGDTVKWGVVTVTVAGNSTSGTITFKEGSSYDSGEYSVSGHTWVNGETVNVKGSTAVG